MEKSDLQLYIYKGLYPKATIVYKSVFLVITCASIAREVVFYIQRDSLQMIVVYLTYIAEIFFAVQLGIGIVYAYRLKNGHLSKKLCRLYEIMFGTLSAFQNLILFQWFHILDLAIKKEPIFPGQCSNLAICYFW